MRSLSVAERERQGLAFKLYAVAQQLPGPFSLEDLAVAAWRAHPNDFGLFGYAAFHPDSSKVRLNLWGRTGLITTRKLYRTADGRYAVKDDRR